MRSDDRCSATETACWQQQMKDGPPSSHPTPEVDEVQCMSLTRSHERPVVAARPSRGVSLSASTAFELSSGDFATLAYACNGYARTLVNHRPQCFIISPCGVVERSGVSWVYNLKKSRVVYLA